MNTTVMQKTVIDYYKQLYKNKMTDLEEMDKFWEKYNLPRVKLEEIEIMGK